MKSYPVGSTAYDASDTIIDLDDDSSGWEEEAPQRISIFDALDDALDIISLDDETRGPEDDEPQRISIFDTLEVSLDTIIGDDVGSRGQEDEGPQPVCIFNALEGVLPAHRQPDLGDGKDSAYLAMSAKELQRRLSEIESAMAFVSASGGSCRFVVLKDLRRSHTRLSHHLTRRNL